MTQQGPRVRRHMMVVSICLFGTPAIAMSLLGAFIELVLIAGHEHLIRLLSCDLLVSLLEVELGKALLEVV